jgi:hypothetical protein
LLDGRVLVAGGVEVDLGWNSVEIYDPASRRWNATGTLHVGRFGHSATLLPDGSVLVAGGATSYLYDPLASAEIYDPSTGPGASPATSIPPEVYMPASVSVMAEPW